MAVSIGSERYLRCPYQAKVMKVFEMKSRTTVSIRASYRARDPRFASLVPGAVR
jgi:hypothetical protein